MGYGSGMLTINVALSPTPGVGVDLTSTLLLCPKATNSLNGSHFANFTSSTAVASYLGLGYISAATAARATAMFAQNPVPQKVVIGNVDLVGAETYATAIPAIAALGATFFGIVDDSDLAATQEAISLYVESMAGTYLYFCQVKDVLWYGGTWPATYSLFQHREWTAVVWHETATAAQSPAYAATGLATNQDNKSGSWKFGLASVTAPAVLTSANLTNLEANYVNMGVAWSPYANWVSKGLNCNNRPIDHLVTAAWFKAKLTSNVTTLIQNKGVRREKLTVDEFGAGEVVAAVKSACDEGVSKAHFREYTDATGVKYPKVSSSVNTTTRTITVVPEAYFTTGADAIVINAYLNE